MKKERGITLIALVITIIVLLILAGVSLRLVVDEDGILERTTTAVDKMNKETDKEEVEMAVLGIKMKYYEEGKPGSLREYMIRNLNEYKTANGTIRCDEVGNVTYVGNGVVTGKIDENGNFELTKEGIVITPASIKLEMKKDEDLPTATLTANLIEVSGEISWTSDNPNVVTVSENGETAIVKAVDEGTTIITAKCGNYEATCEATVIKEHTEAELKGGFAKYDVSYTDVLETSFTYNAYNGWRILSVTPWESDSLKYDISLISTGLPAGINFKRDTFVSNVPESDKVYDENGNLLSGGSIGNWAANNAQYDLYAQTFTVYPNSSAHVSAKMAIGLYYNFEDVIFSATDYNSAVNNRGFFTNIAGKLPGEEVTGSIFRSKDELASKITSVRSVTTTDVAKRYQDVYYVTCPSFPTGGENNQSLWNFQKLNSDVQSAGRNFPAYSTVGSWAYYFASPSYTGNLADFLMCFTGVGKFTYSRGVTTSNSKPFVRPVISLSGVSITYNSENDVYELH